MIFKPRTITTAPEIQLIQRETPPMRLKVAAKRTLNTINTALKPRIKLTVPATSRGFTAAPVSEVPATGAPPIMHKYEGINGSTQGDRNESRPAPKASKIEVFSLMVLIMYKAAVFGYTLFYMQHEINPKNIKALALDLDGTTLLPDAVLGKRTLQCLRTLQGRGVQTIICTGRSVEGAERYRALIGAEGPMVFCNGAEVVDMPSGTILSATLAGLEVADFGIDLARRMGVHYQIYLPAGAYPDAGRWEALITDRETPEGELYRRRTGVTPLVRDLKKIIALPGLAGCVKTMFITGPSLHDEIRRTMQDRFGSRISIAKTTPTFLEIMSAGVSKGAGLTTAMRHRGLRAEAIIAAGDEENDIHLFKVAGFSAAPANAREQVQKAAGLIFGSNAEEGLAAFLEELFGL